MSENSDRFEDFSTLPIHNLFEAQVRRTPDAPAVLCEEGRLSYRELNERANQLAHHLRRFGVRPESLVGLAAERSLEMVIGLLGILKAGGAYLPLDSAFPPDRLSLMIEDGRPIALVTGRQRLSDLLHYDGPTVCLERDSELIAQESLQDPESATRGDNLAYVIYTSGSTGKPKGVMIEHHSLVNYSEAAADEYAIGMGDRVLQFASISFDASAEEIYPCLTRGGTLVLRNESMLGSVSSFLEMCNKWEITVLDLPTAYWHKMTERLAVQELPLPESLRLVIIGGERAIPARLATWRRQIGERVRLVNTYGPTEATIVATKCDLASLPIERTTREVPIGRAVRNARTYILDSELKTVPQGVRGELYIGGAGVARGYLNQPEMTLARFVHNPFSSEKEEERLYRTGDLARYLPDGNIEFCGRIDNQVKINGVRIEPGEIESAIARHPNVREVAVVALENSSHETRLVAYVVPVLDPADSGVAFDVRELRTFVGRSLPKQMLPSAFVVMQDSLPLNANGKLDRELLPPPDRANSELNSGYARPRDPLQYQLQRVWEDLFDRRPIGITDNFFELGGHSLLWVRMMDRMEQVFGKRVRLSTLFSGATIEYLAEALKQESQTESSPVMPIQREGSQPPFYYLHGDFNGGGLYCMNLARHLGTDRPFYALHPHGRDGGAAPRTIEAMAEDHVRALREFQPNGPYLLGGHCNGGLIAFEMAQQLQEQGQEVDQVVLICATDANTRYRALQNVVNLFCSIRGLGPDRRLEIFLRMRARVIRAKEIQDYYTRQLREASKLKARDQIAFVAEKGVCGIKLLARPWTGRVSEDRALGGIPDPILAEERHRKINEIYESAMAAYVPRKYSGRVTLLQPAEWMQGPLDDVTFGWRDVATKVDVRTIPGGHLSCITDHVGELAACLRDCLSNESAEKRLTCDIQGAAVPARV
jgi:amino acid adenylation domain-containing protein